MDILLTTDSRYHVNRKFVKEYLTSLCVKKGIVNGIISVAFVGSRAARTLAKKYINDDQEHPVLTFPLTTKKNLFVEVPGQQIIGEIIISYPQVTLFAADNNREIDKVIAQFLDHAVDILKQSLKV